MPMPDFFFLSETEATVTNPASVTSATSSNLVTATLDYVRSCFLLAGATLVANRGQALFNIASGSYSSGWLRFSFGATNTAPINNEPFFIMAGATTDLFRFVCKTTPANSWAVEYWNGSAWTQIGSTISSPLFSTDKVINIRWIIADSGGEFRVYVNGTEVATLTGDTKFTADTTIANFRFIPPFTSTQELRVFFGIIVDDADTRGLYIDESLTTANGAETGFLNDEGFIDEYIGAPTIADYIVANAAGLRETYTIANITAALAGGTVEGVVIGINAKAVTDPGLLLKGTVRVSGTNYDTASGLRPAAADFADYKFIFEQNPATAAAWTQAEVNAAEIGLKSEA